MLLIFTTFFWAKQIPWVFQIQGKRNRYHLLTAGLEKSCCKRASEMGLAGSENDLLHWKALFERSTYLATDYSITNYPLDPKFSEFRLTTTSLDWLWGLPPCEHNILWFTTRFEHLKGKILWQSSLSIWNLADCLEVSNIVKHSVSTWAELSKK